MTDAYDYLRRRRQEVTDKMLAIGRHLPCRCDDLYLTGKIAAPQWSDAHLFRFDAKIMIEDRILGRARIRSGGTRAPKLGMAGDPSMLRALVCKREMDPVVYANALVLVSLSEPKEEPELLCLLRALWQIGEVYRREKGKERWREYG